MSIDRFASAPVESREEFEQRIRAETQESIKKAREDILQEVANQRIQEQYQNSNSFSNSSGNQSNRQQRRQHHQSSQSNQQNFQRQQQQHSRPPFQQQQKQHIEDEYRPQNVDFMDTNQVLEADASFFEGYQNDQLLQSVMRGDEFEPFQNASQNNPAAWNPAAWNQGGDVPFSTRERRSADRNILIAVVSLTTVPPPSSHSPPFHHRRLTPASSKNSRFAIWTWPVKSRRDKA
ncbi:hypothetical protein QL285_075963 [Trifolium repens]|nr:hypothetical protein QL285_075963 [Trifolium repens]